MGLGEPYPVVRSPGGPRFLADAMLGRLARWLRTLGFDTAFDDAIADDELIRRAVRESRVILTRDPYWEGSHTTRMRRVVARVFGRG
ncbi:MAG TPA: Mut7-C RNAse domain-containing protein [Longimicrobiales bacterium]|nr:Mut7-C RNAse domain-containing protein [Longimicrobiales bacterium]